MCKALTLITLRVSEIWTVTALENVSAPTCTVSLARLWKSAQTNQSSLHWNGTKRRDSAMDQIFKNNIHWYSSMAKLADTSQDSSICPRWGQQINSMHTNKTLAALRFMTGNAEPLQIKTTANTGSWNCHWLSQCLHDWIVCCTRCYDENTCINRPNETVQRWTLDHAALLPRKKGSPNFEVGVFTTWDFQIAKIQDVWQLVVKHNSVWTLPSG